MANIFITGSTDGLGRAAAEQLIAGGHDVVLHARSEARAAEISEFAGKAFGLVVGDLASAGDTAKVADQVNRLGRMDAVIHNAGVYLQSQRGGTPEGHAVTFAVNTLAPYQLTALMARPGRLIYLSSGLHRGGGGRPRDLDWTERAWDAARAYAESKLHVVALAFALSRRWPDVISQAVDPGWVRTRMGGPAAPVDLPTGARTQAWLASSDDPAAKVSGRYWHHMRQAEAAPEASDTQYQDALLGQLAEITGMALPA